MERKCRLLIFLAVWKRPHITRLCFAGINRMRQHPDYDIQVVAVISEEEMIPLCEEFGVDWVMHKNEPLGEKKNAGLKYCQQFEFDYLMEIGSDDLILNELLDSYKPYLGVWDFFGIRDAAYINSTGGQCRRLISKATYGAGRMIKRSLLEKAKWKLWKDGLSRGLDNNSVFAFQSMGVKYNRVDPMEFPCVVDVKSKENIWKFDYFLGVEYDKQEIFKRLSKEEVELIESYVTS